MCMYLNHPEEEVPLLLEDELYSDAETCFIEFVTNIEMH